MTHLVFSLGAAPDLSLLLVAGVPAALGLVLTAWTLRRRNTHPQRRGSGPAVKVAALAALGCTVYSADTSWRFAADYLDMAGSSERAGMFAAAELALFATALMARQNLTAQGAPGVPGTLVWVITGVQVIPAYAESGPIGGTVRAFVGPIMAAMLWHLAMGIELRLRTPGAASHGLLAVLGREARERLLSRLGVAARDRDAAQITRERATTRAVALAARLAERTPEQQRSWHGRRLTRRLSKAIGRASVGTDALQRDQLLAQLAARRHALALATVPLPSPWSRTHGTQATDTVPSAQHSSGTVPMVAHHGPTDLMAQRGSCAPRGPAADSGGRGPTDSGTKSHELGTVPGTELFESHGNGVDSGHTGTSRSTAEVPAHVHVSDRGPRNAETGTGRTGDRGPASTSTRAAGDRGTSGPGTGSTEGQGQKAPLHRKPTPKTKSRGKRQSRSPQTRRPSRKPEMSVEQLVEQVRPHVRLLLERDGNEAVTRVQLREILRREDLPGGRNDRLSLVLQALRSDPRRQGAPPDEDVPPVQRRPRGV